MDIMFDKLNQEEVDALIDALPLITILIGGADGDLDKDEKEWAKKVTEIRAYNHPDKLNEFYKMVGKSYDKKLEAYLKELPADNVEDRTNIISGKLSKINEIFPKLEQELSAELYKSYISFAHHVAKASGGILRFFNVSNEEKALMDLPMLDVIEPVDPA